MCPNKAVVPIKRVPIKRCPLYFKVNIKLPELSAYVRFLQGLAYKKDLLGERRSHNGSIKQTPVQGNKSS